MTNLHQLMGNKIHFKIQLKKAFMAMIHHSQILVRLIIKMEIILYPPDFLLIMIVNLNLCKIKDNKDCLLKQTKIDLMNKNKCKVFLMMLNNILLQIDFINKIIILIDKLMMIIG